MKKRDPFKTSKLSWFMLTLTSLGPSLWLIVNLDMPITHTQILFATFLSIPNLILLGFLWGRTSRDKEVMRLAQEADDLEAELNRIKNKKDIGTRF
ncbi:MAG: hypothetical protein ACI31W_04785 [Lactococcus sp.]